MGHHTPAYLRRCIPHHAAARGLRSFSSALHSTTNLLATGTRITPSTTSSSSSSSKRRSGSDASSAPEPRRLLRAASAVQLNKPTRADVSLVAPPVASSPANKLNEVGDGSTTPAINNNNNVLTNPFQGLHTLLARSYRLDQLTDGATPHDILLAKQEKKSAAFSFLRLTANSSLYEGHWSSSPDVMHQLSHLMGGSSSPRSSSMARISELAKLRQPIPGLSLFNNNLGLDDVRIHTHYPLILAQRLLLLPDALRHIHTLCGRPQVPCDFFADLDLPNTSQKEAELTLMEVLTYLDVRLPGVGFHNPFFLILTNDRPAPGKMSFHIHARSMPSTSTSSSTKNNGGKKLQLEDDDDTDAELSSSSKPSSSSSSSSKKKKKLPAAIKHVAFEDFRAVKLIANEVNLTLGRNIIDESCYRTSGMLRCAYNAKLPSSEEMRTSSPSSRTSGRRLVPMISATDSALQRRLTKMEEVLRTMSDPEILELTFCTRHINTPEMRATTQTWAEAEMKSGHRRRAQIPESVFAPEKFSLVRPRHILGPQSEQAQEVDAYGNLISPYLSEALKWKRFKSVVGKLRTLPPRAADTYDVWVRVGLALHNFGNDDHIFEEWVRFSLRCPQKYSREMCRKKWTQFERNPDALNWRRGFNYLNNTIWRQV